MALKRGRARARERYSSNTRTRTSGMLRSTSASSFRTLDVIPAGFETLVRATIHIESIGRLKAATLPDGRADGVEVIGADDAHYAGWLQTFGSRVLLDVERARVNASAQRQRPDGGGGINPRNGANPWHEPVKERDNAFGFRIRCFRQANACCEEPLGPHPRIDPAEAGEAQEKQTSADQQNQR